MASKRPQDSPRSCLDGLVGIGKASIIGRSQWPSLAANTVQGEAVGAPEGILWGLFSLEPLFC
eukprot:7339391-Pyramimonas_sp.AAC.1